MAWTIDDFDTNHLLLSQNKAHVEDQQQSVFKVDLLS